MEPLKEFTRARKSGGPLECPFCKNIFNRNEELGLPKEESVLYEDDYIYVMPDICPLTVGHLLIITKKHYQGYASAHPDVLQAVERFLTYYEKQIGFRNYTIFEHGAVIAYHAGASIDHAHIHIVPHELNLGTMLDPLFHDSLPCELSDLPKFSADTQPYLFYRIRAAKTGYAYPVGKIKSQTLRDVANQCLKKKETYNWKQAYQKVDSYVEFLKTLAWWRSLSYPVTFKWKKKLILEKFKLASYEEILNGTNRFHIEESGLVIRMIEKELECSGQNSCRLVLVPKEHQYKLPNYVLHDRKDIGHAQRFLSNSEGYQEIWYFLESYAGNNSSFSGRISYNWIGDNFFEYIELVCGDTPREIEAYSKGSDLGYMRVSRLIGVPVYQIEDIRTGSFCKSNDEWQQAFARLKWGLDAYNASLNQFRSMARKYMIRSLSLDFKFDKNRLSFIDWDTSNDVTVLKNESTIER